MGMKKEPVFTEQLSSLRHVGCLRTVTFHNCLQIPRNPFALSPAFLDGKHRECRDFHDLRQAASTSSPMIKVYSFLVAPRPPRGGWWVVPRQVRHRRDFTWNPKVLILNTANYTQEPMRSDSMWGCSVCAAGPLS